jgi:hypothetical protein
MPRDSNLILHLLISQVDVTASLVCYMETALSKSPYNLSNSALEASQPSEATRFSMVLDCNLDDLALRPQASLFFWKGFEKSLYGFSYVGQCLLLGFALANGSGKLHTLH